MQDAQPTRTLAAWLVVFSLVAFGAKLWTIQIWGTNIPYWDQWDEARLLIKPWLEGTVTWHDFFIPHNEHRIFVTRVLDLLEIKLNGQWDPVFQMVVNAVLHTGYGCLLATALWCFAGRKRAGLICCALLPFFALPLAGENVLHGFQSQMYLVSIFSVAAILGLGFGKPAGITWFGGLLAAVIALFTLASGFLAAATVAGLVILRLFKQHRLSRREWLTLISSLAVVAFGLSLKVTVARHEQYQAASMGDFLQALLECMAWPFSSHRVLAFFFCIPLVILFIAHLRREFKNPRAAEFVLALGLFALLQYFVLAYGRAILIESSRYHDTLCLLAIASLASLFMVTENLTFSRRQHLMAVMLMTGWVIVLMLGICQITRVNLRGNAPDQRSGYLYSTRFWGVLETENVRAFIATDDAGWLKSKTELSVPYWNQDWLIGLLSQPKLLAIMPADARQPLKLEPDETLSAGFFTNGCPPGRAAQPFVKAWGNFSTNGTAVAGRFVSRPMSSNLPKLSVQVYRSTADVKIRLIGLAGRTVELNPVSSDRWETLIVTAPSSPFVLSIEDAGPDASVAVGEIKQLGRFSVFSQQLVSHAVLILSIGLCLCIILALAALSRPGTSLANEGLAWLFILPVAVTALIATLCWRHFDADEFTFGVHEKWAIDFANSGHPGRAELHLREALWLQPDNEEAKKELGSLEARGRAEVLPEKDP